MALVVRIRGTYRLATQYKNGDKSAPISFVSRRDSCSAAINRKRLESFQSISGNTI